MASKLHKVLSKINLQVGNENIMIIDNHCYNQVKAKAGSHRPLLFTTSLKSALAT
jgi:hypothetical protein